MNSTELLPILLWISEGFLGILGDSKWILRNCYQFFYGFLRESWGFFGILNEFYGIVTNFFMDFWRILEDFFPILKWFLKSKSLAGRDHKTSQWPKGNFQLQFPFFRSKFSNRSVLGPNFDLKIANFDLFRPNFPTVGCFLSNFHLNFDLIWQQFSNS